MGSCRILLIFVLALYGASVSAQPLLVRNFSIVMECEASYSGPLGNFYHRADWSRFEPVSDSVTIEAYVPNCFNQLVGSSAWSGGSFPWFGSFLVSGGILDAGTMSEATSRVTMEATFDVLEDIRVAVWVAQGGDILSAQASLSSASTVYFDHRATIDRTYWLDISAGTTLFLTRSLVGGVSEPGANFSTQDLWFEVVPEPGSFAVVGVGLLVALSRRRRYGSVSGRRDTLRL